MKSVIFPRNCGCQNVVNQTLPVGQEVANNFKPDSPNPINGSNLLPFKDKGTI